LAQAPQWKKPEWIHVYRKRTAIIDAIEAAFDGSCTCDACRILRDAADELGAMFMPPEGQQPEVVTEGWQRRRPTSTR